MRYLSELSTLKPQYYYVYDTVMQITVFHWYGKNGKEKCDAVAAALNALGHAKD